MWVVHNWVGLYAGVVIAVLSLTGVVALFKHEIDEGLNPSLYKVTPGEHYTSIIPIIDSLRNVYGAENHYQVKVSPRSDKSWSAGFLESSGPLSYKDWEIFFNPYTGKILGKRDYAKSLGYAIRNIHVRLYEGLYGRQIVGLAGIALLISTVTGFWIYGGFMKKQLFGVIRTKNLRIKMADYHKLIGITTLLFNLVIAITGAWLGLQAYLQPVVVGDRPGTYKPDEPVLSKEEDASFSIDFTAAYKQARVLFPELKPRYMMPSTDGSRTLTIMGSVPRTAFEREKFLLTLDKKDLSEVYRYDIRNAPLGDKVFYIQESMHFGDYAGIWLKILYAFFGITSGFLSLTGFIIYLKRTEKGRRDKPKFVELKPLLLRWTAVILIICTFLISLNVTFGVVVPSLIVIVSLYASILFLVIRALVLYTKRRKLRNVASNHE
ncbi:MAG: PepSY domain-containing protein [Cytophagales bacterium]|nr:PepSY domain-containing protein [Cytophagales bacterium]